MRVWQQVLRIDRLVVPADFFAEVRDQIIANQSFNPLPGGINTADTVQLVGQADSDGRGRMVYGVGRVRDNFIWITLAGGAAPATTIQSAIALSDLAMAKYQRLRLSSVESPLPRRCSALPSRATSFLYDSRPAPSRRPTLASAPRAQRCRGDRSTGSGPGREKN